MKLFKKSILQSIVVIVTMFIFLKGNIIINDFILGSIVATVFMFAGNYFNYKNK